MLRTPIITTTNRINGEVSLVQVAYFSGRPLLLPIPGFGWVLAYFTPMMTRVQYTCHKVYVPAFQEGKRSYPCETRL